MAPKRARDAKVPDEQARSEYLRHKKEADAENREEQGKRKVLVSAAQVFNIDSILSIFQFIIQPF